MWGSCTPFQNHRTTPPLLSLRWLSEVDSPGEMYFDSAARNLYIYPVGDDSDKVRLSFQAGPGLFSLSDSTWVTVRDFVITGSSGGIGISGGENNTIGGCTVRNSGGGISLSGGYRNRVIGNDILDVGTHIATTGNSNDGLKNLKPTNNLYATSDPCPLLFLFSPL